MKQLTQIDINNEFFNTRFHKLSQLTGIGELVSLFIKIVFAVSGVIILVFIIMAGIGLIAGAGSNDPEKIEKGKQSATSALIGFVVVFVAYWIVQLIELWTGMKIF